MKAHEKKASVCQQPNAARFGSIQKMAPKVVHLPQLFPHPCIGLYKQQQVGDILHSIDMEIAWLGSTASGNSASTMDG